LSKLKSPDKPVVKYSKGSSGIRYKHTLLATIRGPEARAMIEAQQKGYGCWMYSYNTEKTMVKIYREQTMSCHDSKGKRVRIREGT
jgi:hypothetical protein